MIICIGREFGSGGHEIGLKLSEMLHIPAYDRELIENAAIRSSIGTEELERADEKKTNAWMHSVHYEPKDASLRGRSTNEILFRVQKEIILEFAQAGDCIFIGRCADSILKEAEMPCVSIFIAAPFGDRVKRKMLLLNKDEKSITSLIRKTDKQRKSYYEYYTGGSWGKPYNYDLCVNSSVRGVDDIVRILTAFLADS